LLRFKVFISQIFVEKIFLKFTIDFDVI
jgi:hypothetical protein